MGQIQAAVSIGQPQTVFTDVGCGERSSTNYVFLKVWEKNNMCQTAFRLELENFLKSDILNYAI
jgi:hypothetical protein